jgi:hypothetical protein
MHTSSYCPYKLFVMIILTLMDALLGAVHVFYVNNWPFVFFTIVCEIEKEN